MKKELISVTIMPETRCLVGKIARETNEKKYSIYDRAVRDYARKMGVATAGN